VLSDAAAWVNGFPRNVLDGRSATENEVYAISSGGRRPYDVTKMSGEMLQEWYGHTQKKDSVGLKRFSRAQIRKWTTWEVRYLLLMCLISLH
jgi:hypothetical protein